MSRLWNASKLAAMFERIREPHREPHAATIEYAYHEIGNILVKDQASYRYVPKTGRTTGKPCEGDWCEDHPIPEQTYRSVYRYPGRSRTRRGRGAT